MSRLIGLVLSFFARLFGGEPRAVAASTAAQPSIPVNVGNANYRLNSLLQDWPPAILQTKPPVFRMWICLRMIQLAHLARRTNDPDVVAMSHYVGGPFPQLLHEQGLDRPWVNLDKFFFESICTMLAVDRIAATLRQQTFRGTDSVARAVERALAGILRGRGMGPIKTSSGPAGGGRGRPPAVEASVVIRKKGRDFLLALDAKRNSIAIRHVEKFEADCRSAHLHAKRQFARVQPVLVVTNGVMSGATFLAAVKKKITPVEVAGVLFDKNGRVA